MFLKALAFLVTVKFSPSEAATNVTGHRFDLVAQGKVASIEPASSWIAEKTEYSNVGCASRCMADTSCGGFEYVASTQKCRLMSTNNSTLNVSQDLGANVFWGDQAGKPSVVMTSSDTATTATPPSSSATSGAPTSSTSTLSTTTPLALTSAPTSVSTSTAGTSATTSISSSLTTSTSTSQSTPTTTTTVPSTTATTTLPTTTTTTLPTTTTTTLPTTTETRVCTAPGSYGLFADVGYDGSPKLPGQTIVLSCKKGSAFNAAELIQKGYATTIGGGDVAVNDRFRTITLTCNGTTLTWQPSPAEVPQCQDFLECLRTSRGKEYFGTAYNKTETGKSCVSWSSSPLTEWTSMTKNGIVFPIGAKADQGPYCRNPGRDADKTRPWCYVNATAWEFCNIPACLDPTVSTLECRLTSDGYDYLGKTSSGIGSVSCAKWSDNSWTASYDYNRNFADNANPIHSYCRNPARDFATPWCYVGQFSTAWVACSNINACPGFP